MINEFPKFLGRQWICPSLSVSDVESDSNNRIRHADLLFQIQSCTNGVIPEGLVVATRSLADCHPLASNSNQDQTSPVSHSPGRSDVDMPRANQQAAL